MKISFNIEKHCLGENCGMATTYKGYAELSDDTLRLLAQELARVQGDINPDVFLRADDLLTLTQLGVEYEVPLSPKSIGKLISAARELNRLKREGAVHYEEFTASHSSGLVLAAWLKTNFAPKEGG